MGTIMSVGITIALYLLIILLILLIIDIIKNFYDSY